MVSPAVPYSPLGSRMFNASCVCACVCVCVCVRERERERARERASERAGERVRGSFSATVFEFLQEFLASCDAESASGTRARARSKTYIHEGQNLCRIVSHGRI